MARIRRNSEQTLEFKIEQAEAKVARTREAHEKAVDELKKLYDIRKAYQRDELLKALESIAILLISANSRCVEPPFAIVRTYCF